MTDSVITLRQPLTLEEVAEIMRCSVKTVRRAINDGELEAFSVSRRAGLRVRPEALEQWMATKSTRRTRPLRALPAPIDPTLPAKPRSVTRRGGVGRLEVTPEMGRAA